MTKTSDLLLKKNVPINEMHETIRRKPNMTGDNNVTKTASKAVEAIPHKAVVVADNGDKEAKALPNTEAEQSYQHPPSTVTSTRTPSASDIIGRDL